MKTECLTIRWERSSMSHVFFHVPPNMHVFTCGLDVCLPLFSFLSFLLYFQIVFWRVFVCITFNDVSVAESICRWGQMPIKTRGIRPPRDGVRGSCGLLSVYTRNQTESSANCYTIWEPPGSLFISRNDNPLFLKQVAKMFQAWCIYGESLYSHCPNPDGV